MSYACLVSSSTQGLDTRRLFRSSEVLQLSFPSAYGSSHNQLSIGITCVGLS
jgi:hypothetical protein